MMTFYEVDKPTLTLRVLCQCGCVHYLKKVLVMPKMSVWGRPRELISGQVLPHNKNGQKHKHRGGNSKSDC